MAEYHIIRRTAASTSAVNLAVACDLPIDSTASTPITAPGGYVKEIAFSACNPGAEVATAGVVFAIRLSGAAVVNGPQDFDGGSFQTGATSTALSQLNQPGMNRYAVNIPLKVNLPLVIQVFWNGLDSGTQMAQVEIVIEA